MLRGSWVSLAVAAAPIELARSDGQSGVYPSQKSASRRSSIDFLEPRFRIINGMVCRLPEV